MSVDQMDAEISLLSEELAAEYKGCKGSAVVCMLYIIGKILLLHLRLQKANARWLP